MLDYRSEPQPLPSSCWNPPNSNNNYNIENNNNNNKNNNTTNTNTDTDQSSSIDSHGNIASDPLLLSDDELWKFIQTNSTGQ